MKYSLNITDRAEEDILSTVRYITNVLKNSIAANSLLDEIEKHEKILEETPGIYPSVHDEYLAEKGLKSVTASAIREMYAATVRLSVSTSTKVFEI